MLYEVITAYAAAKARVFHGHGVLVVNADDPAVEAMVVPGRERNNFV